MQVVKLDVDDVVAVVVVDIDVACAAVVVAGVLWVG